MIGYVSKGVARSIINIISKVIVCKMWEEVDNTLGQLVKWCTAILFLVVRLSSFRSVVEFLPVSPI